MVPPYSHGDSSCPAVLWIRIALLRFAYGALTRYGRPSHAVLLTPQIHVSVLTPWILLPMVWPLPLSLATTSGISVDFFSSPYLDVSVQAVPFVNLWIQLTIYGCYTVGVSPFGYPRINAHLQLPVAFRSLSRPSSALSAKAFPLRSF